MVTCNEWMKVNPSGQRCTPFGRRQSTWNCPLFGGKGCDTLRQTKGLYNPNLWLIGLVSLAYGVMGLLSIYDKHRMINEIEKSTSNERVCCTTQLAELSFSH